ncbi:MAG TPA: hypothetical protein VGS28_00495 [Candidatus Saccharimonadales bacterium]|nr:hypothetical protein [Candidatus Saccharimonadales bacterium]
MGRKNKSKKWAIWLLQGASLAQNSSILKAAKASHASDLIFENERYAYEILDLIAYLNRKTTSASMAKDWFEGKMWTAPTNLRKMKKEQKEAEEKNRELYQSENRLHWVGSSHANHVLSEPHHPAYKSVRYSFYYSSQDPRGSYSLVSDDESIAKTNHYALRLTVEVSAFALCNDDNVFEYSQEEHETLAEIHAAISDSKKYMLIANTIG